ncbi:unnamed protein product [Dicrocoelium dendriticum]|nr:unnamed protein product [Dicrocoelium dendriticum]
MKASKNASHLSRSHLESDEGYDGSDEQDRLRRADQLADANTRLGLTESSQPNHQQRGANRPVRKACQGRRFRVRLLDRLGVEQRLRDEAESFLKEELFAHIPHKQLSAVNRVQPSMLVSLAAKLKARQKR